MPIKKTNGFKLSFQFQALAIDWNETKLSGFTCFKFRKKAKALRKYENINTVYDQQLFAELIFDKKTLYRLKTKDSENHLFPHTYNNSTCSTEWTTIGNVKGIRRTLNELISLHLIFMHVYNIEYGSGSKKSSIAIV